MKRREENVEEIADQHVRICGLTNASPTRRANVVFAAAAALVLIVSTAIASLSPLPQDPTKRVAFEVASIRPGNSGAGGRGGGVPASVGCGGGLPQIDPGRFAINEITLNQLIVMAYPEWAVSERWLS
jgi:hypothetical protein